MKYPKTQIGSRLMLLPFFILLAFSSCFSQSGEIGIGVGTFNYRGEISPRYDFSFQRPGGSIFYRHNYSPIFSIRGAITGGLLGANNQKYSDALSQDRELQFQGTIFDFSLTPEYNFYNFRGKGNIPKATVYFFSGISVFNMNTNAPAVEGIIGPVNVAIPMGIGMKAMLGDLTNIGLEFGARKTFTDLIDGVNDTWPNGKQRGFRYDKDWYYYAGISLSYVIYNIPCPYFSY